METPESTNSHKGDYLHKAWCDYSIHELGWWVHLFCKRATHRQNPDKKAKDLYDAQNYLNMMQSHIDSLK